MNYLETIEYLYKKLPVFHHIGKAAYKADLINILLLSEKLSNPHLDFKSIHVAGTNGKGSVSHMLASVFQQAGYKTGLYTSPHLLDFCERIKIDGNPIEQEEIVRFVENHISLIDDVNPSFFELVTAMAFDYFSNNKVDIAIIETGLGGRLDATNIVRPLLSVITNISYDHMDILGNTLEKIAIEKAGIIKTSVPVVIGESQNETKNVFIQKAKELGCPLCFADSLFSTKSISADNHHQILELTRLSNGDKGNYSLDLAGSYQEKNIKTAMAALDMVKSLKLNIPENAIVDGLENAAKNTGLQGRWQILQKRPLVITDTGHNEAGIKLIMDQLKKIPHKQMHIVFGMVKDKDIQKVIQLLPKDASYYFTKANIIRALNEKELQNVAKEAGLNGNAYEFIPLALEAALSNAQPEDIVFAGGSTFVAAEVIDFFNKKLNTI